MKTIGIQKQEALSYEELTSNLDYNINTGAFTWKISASNRAPIGSAAGTLKTDKNLVIKINKRVYYAHRLAWFYVYKEWPKGIIDHIDRNPQNNAISNLRDTTNSLNQHNINPKINNTSGYTGVYYSERQRRWKAQIIVNRKVIYLGCFIEKKFAIKARKEAEKQYQLTGISYEC